MPLVRLRISTDLYLDPGFCEAPAPFARRRGVPLVGDVSPETSYKMAPAPHEKDTHEKAARIKANIHLVQHGAIRLLAELGDSGDVRLRSIDLNPSMLLYEAKNHPLTEYDLLVSLGTLKASVAPLLADPRDACHIVPGLAGDAGSVSYWSAIMSEVFLPDIPLPGLRDLRHPLAGAAKGAGRTRIQLGNDGDSYTIRFEKARLEMAGPHGVQDVDGVRARLSLKGHALPAAFRDFGTTALVNEIRRLVSFPASGVARVHHGAMSRLEGNYLPVPPEWGDKDQGKPVTHAKVMALVSQLTAIPGEELIGIDEGLRQPSASTRKRLGAELAVEAGRLAPVPVSTLFGSGIHASPVPGIAPDPGGQIDGLVARHYGSD